MSIDLIKFAFIGGEVSENYFGRSDLEKYDLSLELCENWFVDYLGGLSTQPGTEWKEYVQHDDKITKFFPFKFAAKVSNTYCLLFGDGYIRFLQDGSYILEDSIAVAGITRNVPGHVTTVAEHHYNDGDWIKFPVVKEMVELTNLTCEVANAGVFGFNLLDPFGNPLDTSAFTALTSTARVSRIYTIDSPYAVNDLARLSVSQTRDTIKLTHVDYPTYNLVRRDNTDWKLSLESFSPNQTFPTGLSGSPFSGGGRAVGYVVTSVNHDGEESGPSDMDIESGIGLDGGGNWGVSLSWTPVAGTDFYRIYATRFIANGGVISHSMQTGYVGQSKGSNFVDNGITPDFSITPPLMNNPFADGAIINIDIDNVGAGYDNSSVITVSDPNHAAGGFRGSVLVQGSSGRLAGIAILNPGHDYTNPVFTVTVGSGAVLSATLREATGNNPSTSTVFQQRQIYAATENKPLTFFGSRIDQFSNFNISDILIASDSYEHELDSEDASPIRHMIPVRGGLMIFTASNVWLAYGSSGSITATNVQADTQDSEGASVVKPVKIEGNIIYYDNTGSRLISLVYNDNFKLYGGSDLSLLANHLLSKDNKATAMGYASTPNKIVWSRREDGVMLCLTIITEQKVLAWARRTTRGEFIDVLTLQERSDTSVYLMVRRYVNGRWTKLIERVASRNFTHDEDSICLDCSLKLAVTHPGADLQVAATTGDGVLATISDTIFTVNDVGKIIRSGGGKMRVVSFVDAETVTVDIIRPITQLVKNLVPDYPAQTHSGDWSMDAEVTTISNLWHLNNEEVVVVADGNVVRGLTVRDGVITLPRVASRVVVGWGYRCIAKPLPLNIPGSVTEDKRKRITGLAMRVKDARALSAGMDLNYLYHMAERTDELYGEPNKSQKGMIHVSIEPFWDDEASPYIVQDEPLPATLLGYIVEAEIGDDPN